MNKKSLFVCFLIGLIIFSSISACKKPEETEKDNVTPTAAKWSFIPYDFFTHKSDFYEDKDGNIAYRNRHTLYLFDEKGNLRHSETVNISQTNESTHFNFIKDGSFFLKMSPFNAPSSDFILYYKRLGPFSYSRPTMIDIRKLDSLNRYTAEYYIHDIIADNFANSSSTGAWVLASKYPDVSALYRNSNPQPVMIELNTTHVGSEYLLPKDVFYARAATSSSHITLFSPSSQTLTFDKVFSSVGTQQVKSLIPNILVMGNYVVKTANGYYLSKDMIQVKDKVLGVPNEAKIMHSKDSLLHIYNGSFSTINAITGSEVFKLDIKSEKMPIDIDTVNTFDYYRTQKGISYLITSRGIVVIN